MFTRMFAVPALAVALISLPQSCSQIDLANRTGAVSAYALTAGDPFGFKAGSRLSDPEPPPPDPPDPCEGPSPPPNLCGEGS